MYKNAKETASNIDPSMDPMILLTQSLNSHIDPSKSATGGENPSFVPSISDENEIDFEEWKEWVKRPEYQQKLEELYGLCRMNDVQQAKYPYLVRFQELDLLMWNQPIPSLSIAAPKHNEEFLEQSKVVFQGGVWLINGKPKAMLKKPVLKSDYIYVFGDLCPFTIFASRGNSSSTQ